MCGNRIGREPMASDLIFYTNPQSRGRIARWMLEEVGAPYETQVMDYASTMKGDAYRAINPMGKVPAIVHRGHVVTECAAICAYLVDALDRKSTRLNSSHQCASRMRSS